MKTESMHESSFRDPSGFIFYKKNVLYRQINLIFKDDYDLFMDSGLYAALVDKKLLVEHEEVDVEYAVPSIAYKIIRPEIVPFISYPYEWCFSQLKDAALVTLEIQKIAIDFGLTLKDCSAYNVQYVNEKPVFIDTLSFERYTEGEPWVAYGQFCRHFLAPLALMRYRDVRLNQLFRTFIDGVPLDLASELLPFSTRLNFSILTNVHLHAKSQKLFSDKEVEPRKGRVSRIGLIGLIDNLESSIRKFQWKPRGTEWADYYGDTNYSSEAFDRKKRVVAEFLDEIKPATAWDLGANTGVFSRIASEKGIRVISSDADPAAVELNYLYCKKKGDANILPLLLDLTNPSPGLGWASSERSSFISRGPADAAMALALIHHLAISNNVPFKLISDFFSKICKALIVEFIPKSDSQVQRLLATRKDIFTDYSREAFEASIEEHFEIIRTEKILDSGRILYLCHGKRLSE